MEISYGIASKKDIAALTGLWIEVLLAANRLDSSSEMRHIGAATEEYYGQYFEQQVTCLALCDQQIIACGSICYYKLMPTYMNPRGDYAYIMNMYTKPHYRKRGIAAKILDMLVQDALAKNIRHIMLETTELGKSLYFKYGFIHYDENLILNFAESSGDS